MRRVLLILAVLVTACNLERKIGPDGNPVTSVIVSPDTVMLDPAQAFQFQAFGRDAAGDPVPVNPAWSATAGAITSSGMYTADTTENDADVTARITLSGVTLSASSRVRKRRIVAIVLTPANTTLRTSETQQFTTRGVRNSGDTVSVNVNYATNGGTITTNGLYRAGSSAGTYRVIATYPRNGLADTSFVTVTAIPVASVTVTPDADTIPATGTTQLTAVTRDSAGNILTGRSITWSSSASGVATVSATGLVTGVAAGSATITATSEGKSGTAAVTVTVPSPAPVATVTVTPTPTSVLAGATVQLTATLKDSAGNVLVGRTITWTSSATGVATVSTSGLVTGVTGGTATITATSESKSGTALVTVTVPIPVATVTVTPNPSGVRVGGTLQLTAVTKDSAGNVLTGRTITWTSSATGVATVSATGRVTGVSAGSATITATSEGQDGTSALTVTLVPVATVTVTPNPTSIFVGGTAQLIATLRDSAGNMLTGRSVTWTSGATGVATVSVAGLVSGVAVGNATITATSEGKTGTAAVSVSQQTARAGFYVSPSGTSGGDGSAVNPWNLQTALSGAGGRIQPGDTVWLRGGTYTGSFTSTLRGTAAEPIVVRQYPGERATIDRNGTSGEPLVVDGTWTIYWGFEIKNSSTVRFGSGLAARPAGVYVRNASNVKLINLIVHDTGHGTYVEEGAQNIEIYGWIIYNGGSDNSSRGDGHGIYIRNNGTTPKIVRDNVIFDQFGFGLHGYAEGGDRLDRMIFEGNVVFNNGDISAFDSPNMILGGVTSATNDTVRNNMFYFSPGAGSSVRNVRLGYDVSQNGTALFEGNYIVGGSHVLDVTFWQNLTLRNNTLIGTGRVLALADQGPTGYTWSNNRHYRDPMANAWREVTTDYTFSGWQQATGLGGTDVASSGTPTQPQVFVRPNQYEPGRGHVVVYNWNRQATVAVDLSGVLRVGDPYEIRNVQQLFGTPLLSGMYSGGSIAIPMAAVTPTAPIGGSPNAPRPTGPDFGVFLITSGVGAATVAHAR